MKLFGVLEIMAQGFYNRERECCLLVARHLYYIQMLALNIMHMVWFYFDGDLCKSSSCFFLTTPVYI